jgi:hypothetical protein
MENLAVFQRQFEHSQTVMPFREFAAWCPTPPQAESVQEDSDGEPRVSLFCWDVCSSELSVTEQDCGVKRPFSSLGEGDHPSEVPRKRLRQGWNLGDWPGENSPTFTEEFNAIYSPILRFDPVLAQRLCALLQIDPAQYRFEIPPRPRTPVIQAQPTSGIWIFENHENFLDLGMPEPMIESTLPHPFEAEWRLSSPDASYQYPVPQEVVPAPVLAPSVAYLMNLAATTALPKGEKPFGNPGTPPWRQRPNIYGDYDFEPSQSQLVPQSPNLKDVMALAARTKLRKGDNPFGDRNIPPYSRSTTSAERLARRLPPVNSYQHCPTLAERRGMKLAPIEVWPHYPTLAARRRKKLAPIQVYQHRPNLAARRGKKLAPIRTYPYY